MAEKSPRRLKLEAEPRRGPGRHVPPLRPGRAVPPRRGCRGGPERSARPDRRSSRGSGGGLSAARPVVPGGGRGRRGRPRRCGRGSPRPGPGATGTRRPRWRAARAARRRPRSSGAWTEIGTHRPRLGRTCPTPRRSRDARDLHLPQPHPLRRRVRGRRWPRSWPGSGSRVPWSSPTGARRRRAWSPRSSRRARPAVVFDAVQANPTEDDVLAGLDRYRERRVRRPGRAGGRQPDRRGQGDPAAGHPPRPPGRLRPDDRRPRPDHARPAADGRRSRPRPGPAARRAAGP